ncbi:MAG: hypothetical protein KDC03_03210 [Flavobacteriales bacterium]|nr:hypothetical protein [Flavobacteriales bacterium]
MTTKRTVLALLLSTSIGMTVQAGSAHVAHDHEHQVRRAEYVRNDGQWQKRVAYRVGVEGTTMYV